MEKQLIVGGAATRASLFADLPREDLEALVSTFQRQQFAKGEVLVENGGPGGSVFIIERGRVRISLTGSDDREVTLAHLTDGECFGEMSMLDGEPRSARATAVVDTTVLVGTRDDFLRSLEANPRIGLSLLVTMSRRLRAANELIESLSFLDVQGRVARLLLDIADREGTPVSEGIAVPLPYTRQEMASLVSTSRETFTRALKNFERLKYIRLLRRKAIILNEPRLRLKTR
jgi:CRP/FNR family transcriptional regulator/CRP/FNR family cyclic AMP-dependent transcriptional regulator